jgi:UDP-N-acetyl-alpha-D-muramoyl-L-alanyl-L-glutamate epimerase
MPQAVSFAFHSYAVDASRSTVSFTYRVEFRSGRIRTYTDKLILKDVQADAWARVPRSVLEPTLQALLLMLGINYWCAFPTRDIRIKGFALTREQARFWDTLYLHGLAEFFYDMQMDFRGLISFPYSDSKRAPVPTRMNLPVRALLLNGAGKDSILSAEMLKAADTPFDFFAFAPTPAHERIASLVDARNIRVTRRRDPRVNFLSSLHSVSSAYPSVSTFTFIAVLLTELLGYDSIIFSNERSADCGNLVYLGLPVNHQWCKSSEAEKLVDDYIRSYITPSISTRSLLRAYSELEIVRRFVQYPKYLAHVTSCNNYFWLPRPLQLLSRKGYWCRRCPKCVFLFACFSAYLPKKEVVNMFGGNLYADKRLLPLFRRLLGIEGFKPLDCVGEPEEMILAMHLAARRGEYEGESAMRIFEEHFASAYDIAGAEKKIFASA